MSSPVRPESAPTPTGKGREPLRLLRRHPILAVLGVLAIGVVVLVLLWDWNWFKRPIERQVEARTGREFDIGGELDVDLGWVPTVRMHDLRFGNAEWAKEPTMATAERLEFAFELRPLFSGDIRIPRIRLSAPRLRLEKGQDGTGNWQFGDSDGEGPQFRRIWIDDGRLHFLDASRKTDIKVTVASAAPDPKAKDRSAGDSAPIDVKGGGLWHGNEFTVRGNAESPLALGDRDSPYRIDAHAQAGATRAHARGTLLDPLRLRDFNIQLALSGKNLEDLYPLIGIATPPTPPYKLDGRLTREARTWRYDDFTGVVGDSDLAGDASVDNAGKRPYLRANLVSKRLDFDDLAGFVGAAPKAGKGESTNPELAAQAARQQGDPRVLPDTPYKLERLRAMDADVRWKASRIDSPGLPLDDMDAHLLLENGVLRLQPLNFGVAGGDIRSTIRMDAREETIRTRAELRVQGLDLSKLLPKVELAQNAIGKVGGDITLAGSGNSIAKMLASSNGEVALGIGRGSISNLLMEMAGIDLAEIIKFKLGGDRQIPLRCAFGDFRVSNGVMTTRALAFDTTDTILVGEGTVSLRDETLDLTIKPRPKDRSLLSLRSPLIVDGTFKQPSVRPDYARVGLRAAIALVLGSIAPPAALLATLELGPGEDSQCGGRYAK